MVLYTDNQRTSLTDDHGFYKAAIYTLFVVSLLIALLNALVVLSVVCFTPKHYSFSWFICSSSIADILQFLGPVSLSLHIYITRHEHGFEHDGDLCKTQGWLITFLRIVSTLSILLLSIDRSLSLSTQTFYSKKWKGLLLAFIVLIFWLFSAFIASWPLLFGVGKSIPLSFCPRIYCLFTRKSLYTIIFASIQLACIASSVGCILYATNSSQQSLFRASYSSSTGKVAVQKTRHLVHEQYNRKVSKMAAVVVGIYTICLFPWLISLFLDYFTIPYPQIYGLLSLQFPMVSSLCNPFIYGLIWPPFRRAYEKALTSPLRMCRKNSPSHRSCDFEDSNRSYNFWTIERMNAGQQVSTIDRLFDTSPQTHDPIEIMPHELRMFENEGLTTDSISLDQSFSSFKDNDAPVAATNIALDVSAQFQSILDLIEEMTDGKTKGNFSPNQTSLKRCRSKAGSIASSIDRSAVHVPRQTFLKRCRSETGSNAMMIERSAVKLTTHAPSQRALKRCKSEAGSHLNGIDRSAVKLNAHAHKKQKARTSHVGSFDRPVVNSAVHAPTAGLTNGNVSMVTIDDETDMLNSSISSGVSSCVCLGKSKFYKLDKRYLDYLVNEEIKEMAKSSEAVVFVDV